MPIQRWKSIVYSCVLLLLAGCVEPYAPDVIVAPNQFLVVDGFINTNGITTIKLSRTQNISEEQLPTAETGATMLLEEEQGTTYFLQETTPGTYTSSNLSLDAARKYRITIHTSAGQNYASEYVAVKQTPPIDNISWQALDNKLQIYVNSHDPENNTHYYRWEYEATWAFTAAFGSNIRYDAASGKVVPRTLQDEDIYHCWKTDKSTDIKLGATSNLTKDVIHEYAILTLPSTAEELRFKYSVLVKQYALTQEAYQYWETLRKNTEGIGTLFDPLPSQLTGNVHNLSDATEPVIGYVGASTVKEKRIFITRNQLPADWHIRFPTCQLDSLLPIPPETFEELAGRFRNGNYLPVSEIYPPMGFPTPIGYTAAAKECVDCRTRGTNVKPDFWE
ncbi:DUF4249 domain-containing protein [Pontibacter chitinilyticus]|uniref:DUF4249 domain-containing protein n=1 Tax=Pontibacter chitinilyticus TaxID=2674989 RepID=UPI003219DCAA